MLILLASLQACTYDANIVGGTAEQREALALALDEMTSAVSADVHISRIKLGSVRRTGRYSTVDRSIKLDDQVPLDELVSNFKHELCHAFDLQIGLDSADDSFWTFRSPTLRDSYSNRIGRREAFAQICAHGPEAWAMVEDCTTDGSNLVEYRQYLFDLVASPPALVLDPQGQTEVDQGWSLADANPTEGGRIAVFMRGLESQREFLSLDPHTGAPAAPEGALIPTGDADGNPIEPWIQESGVPLVGGSIGGVHSWTDVAGHTYRTAVLEDATGLIGTRCVSGNAIFVEIAPDLWLVEHSPGLLQFSMVVR